MISTPISSRTLALGLRGEDVLRLQKFMNQNGFVLANSSYGSAGKETTYYGPLLRNAVIRFQESYTSTLLTPRGLTKGTGIVDSLTLKKINELAVKKPLR